MYNNRDSTRYIDDLVQLSLYKNTSNPDSVLRRFYDRVLRSDERRSTRMRTQTAPCTLPCTRAANIAISHGSQAISPRILRHASYYFTAIFWYKLLLYSVYSYQSVTVTYYPAAILRNVSFYINSICSCHLVHVIFYYDIAQCFVLNTFCINVNIKLVMLHAAIQQSQIIFKQK